jgi:hypothetical protein
MWRVILAASMLLTLAFGSLADAKCAVCVESVRIETENGGTTLRFTARTVDPSSFPETGTAVVMQFDGNRGKCLNVSLIRTGIENGQITGQPPTQVATYVGRFNFIYQGATTISGRADLGGTIYEFSAPLDGKPGTITVSSYEGALSGVGAPAIVRAPVTITPDPATIDPRLLQTQAPQPQQQAVSAGQPVANLVDGLTSNTIGVLGLIVVAVAIVSAYFDRKRSLARTTAS